MHLAHYLGLLQRAEENLAQAYRDVGEAHSAEVDVFHLTRKIAKECDAHVEALRPFADSYGREAPDEPDRLHSELFRGTRSGGLGLLRDLQDLYLMACECDIAWTMVGQGAQGARDPDLLQVVHSCEGQTAIQMKWLSTRMKQAAPQALVVAD
jgi:hypothetical protein